MNTQYVSVIFQNEHTDNGLRSHYEMFKTNLKIIFYCSKVGTAIYGMADWLQWKHLTKIHFKSTLFITLNMFSSKQYQPTPFCNGQKAHLYYFIFTWPIFGNTRLISMPTFTFLGSWWKRILSPHSHEESSRV